MRTVQLVGGQFDGQTLEVHENIRVIYIPVMQQDLKWIGERCAMNIPEAARITYEEREKGKFHLKT